MTDEIKLHKATSRAAQAETLLRNELLAEAFAALDATYIEAWRATHVHDDAGRQRLWQAVQCNAKVRDHLMLIVTNGKLAQAELDAIAKRPKRVA